MILMTFRSISEKMPKKLVDFFPQICDDKIFKPESLNLRFSIISCVGGVNTVCSFTLNIYCKHLIFGSYFNLAPFAIYKQIYCEIHIQFQ